VSTRTLPWTVPDGGASHRRKPEKMIEIDQLEYVHANGIPALRGVKATLESGRWTALIGANGSGKTTLARCLNGLLTPTSGAVRVDGVTVARDSVAEIRQRVAMVFQNPDDQLVAPTVETDIAFGLENHGVEPTQMRRRVEEILRRFHLDHYRSHPPHLLSGGERQRLAVAAAVAVQPDFLILDEPTALLDPTARAELMDLVGQLCQQGLGVLHITQSPEEAARAERILVLHEGLLVDDGTPRHIYRQPASLRRIGLAAPFAVEVAVAAGGGAAQAIDPVELSDWLVRTFEAPPQECLEVAAQPAPGAARMSVEGLTHIYRVGVPDPVIALQSVDLAIPAGTITALVGPSGSGKTTLVQHLNGLLRPTSGRVCLDGEDIWLDGDGRGARREVGLVFQFPEDQLFEETVAADVAFGPRNHGCSAAEIEQRTTDALNKVDLPITAFGTRPPLALSGGERRRAAIAGVLAIAPTVIVLDEPTAGLDPANEAVVADLLSRLAADGVSVVLVSHDMDRVAELASQVCVMDQGRVRWQGATRQILESASRRQEDEQPTIEPPAPLRLSFDLRQRGWQAPSLLTRAEACRFVGALRRRRVPASQPIQKEQSADARTDRE